MLPKLFMRSLMERALLPKIIPKKCVAISIESSPSPSCTQQIDDKISLYFLNRPKKSRSSELKSNVKGNCNGNNQGVPTY